MLPSCFALNLLYYFYIYPNFILFNFRIFYFSLPFSFNFFFVHHNLLLNFFNSLFFQPILCCASISLNVLLISSCTSFEIHLIIKKRDIKPLLNDYWIFLNIFIFFHLCCARSKYFLIFSQKLSFFLTHLHTILFISIYL